MSRMREVECCLDIKMMGYKYKITGDSSVGRAVDCRSIGRVFNSPSPEIYFEEQFSISSTFGVVVTYFPSKEMPRFRLPEGAHFQILYLACV